MDPNRKLTVSQPLLTDIARLSRAAWGYALLLAP
jgi:hypothetical protein